jgi:haloacetate dehalogenase
MRDPHDAQRRQFLEAATLLGTLPTLTSTAAAQTAPSAVAALLPGFQSLQVATSGATINAVRGGSGPPLLLLHGWPQSLVEWHVVAPLFAQHYTVVAADLRGYGDSSKPNDGDNHSGYSKRSMAQDHVELMTKLGFDRFAVVGHDRGGRVAQRMALDHADRVSRLAVLDIVPTLKVYSAVNKQLATAYYHWFFLIQPAPFPETLIGNNSEFFLRRIFGGLIPNKISGQAFAEYLRCFSNPATLHAMCEDYRAAASIDLEHDQADLAKKIACPLLTLWGARGAMQSLYDVPATWRERAGNVTGDSLPCGHWLPEEMPQDVFTRVHDFLKS